MSNRLELPSLGILPDRYDRVTAPTLAAMNAFVPEATAVSPMCYCAEDGLTYVWNGTSWGIG